MEAKKKTTPEKSKKAVVMALDDFAYAYKQKSYNVKKGDILKDFPKELLASFKRANLIKD